ncbi:MAG: FKBP-type peptidyl-prolyl cis-trans isomerase [archaeon]
MAEKIQEGDFITIDYIGRVKDTGMIFDLTNEEIAKKEGLNTEGTVYGPVTVVVGARHVVPGLDKQLSSLSVGEKKKIDIESADAFGSKDAELVKLVPMNVFKRQKVNPIPGMPVELERQKGIVKSVSGGRVKVDFNHPLAGKTLEYEVEVKGKIIKAEEQVRSILKLHVPSVEIKDVKIAVTEKEVEISTPNEMQTRRYINLTEEITARDILKYVKGANRVRFVDVFEKGESNIKNS